MAEVLWRPHPGPQTSALSRPEGEVLMGGGRGSGKTSCALAWILRWVNNPRLRFLVIRRNSRDLDDWVDRAKQLWPKVDPRVEFVQGEVRFGTGAIGRFGHLHDEDAYEKYQGHEYQKMLFEELTHIPSEELYLKIKGSCRSTVEGLRPQVFATTNPDGPGTRWVKKRFVDVAKHGERYTDQYGNTRVYIHAIVEDNPTLVENDPGYIQYLDSLPGDLKKAWREGSWDLLEVKGSYYANYIKELREKKQITKVPYDRSALVHTWWDIGIGDSTVIIFFQQIGREWHIIDCHDASGEGLQYYVGIIKSKGYLYGNHYAPHDIENRELSAGAMSRKQVAAQLGLYFQTVPRLSIDDGIQAVRTRFNILWIDEEKCEKLIEALYNYRKEFDETRQVWKSKPLHDWTSDFADALRYWAVTDFKERTGTSLSSKRLQEKIRNNPHSAVIV